MKGSLQFRSKVASAHLVASFLVALVVGGLVVLVWYPGPLREISGGSHLLLLLLTIDMALGPMLTFVLANSLKPRRELFLDIGLVAMVQVLALSYGLWTVFSARPVYLVYEVDRFQVITPSSIDLGELVLAPEGLRSLPLFGPRVIGVRSARSQEEKLHSLDLALAGKDVAKRPDWWVELSDMHRPILTSRGVPLRELRGNNPTDALEIKEAIERNLSKADHIRVYPIVGRKTDWSALVDTSTLEIVDFVEVDGFN